MAVTSANYTHGQVAVAEVKAGAWMYLRLDGTDRKTAPLEPGNDEVDLSEIFFGAFSRSLTGTICVLPTRSSDPLLEWD
jgi:hypothetical protein